MLAPKIIRGYDLTLTRLHILSSKSSSIIYNFGILSNHDIPCFIKKMDLFLYLRFENDSCPGQPFAPPHQIAVIPFVAQFGGQPHPQPLNHVTSPSGAVRPARSECSSILAYWQRETSRGNYHHTPGMLWPNPPRM